MVSFKMWWHGKNVQEYKFKVKLVTDFLLKLYKTLTRIFFTHYYWLLELWAIPLFCNFRLPHISLRKPKIGISEDHLAQKLEWWTPFLLHFLNVHAKFQDKVIGKFSTRELP